MNNKRSIRRLPAEWEPQSAIQFTLPHRQSDWAPYLQEVLSCFRNLLRLIAPTQKVVLVCEDEAEAKAALGASLDWQNMLLFELPANDTWARDHGPIIVQEDDKPIVLDFTFNGWGDKFPSADDNLITAGLWSLGVFGDAEKRTIELVLEGGSIESDGNGTIISTAQCLDHPQRNPSLSRAELMERLKKELGAERILMLEHGYLTGDDTDAHIDTLVRFCNPQTLAYVKCDDPADVHFDELQRMEKVLQSWKTLGGLPYHLIPLPLPDACYDPEDGHRLPATYANFIITNDWIIVPTYQQEKDEIAMERLQDCFSDRKVVGVDALPIIRQHGSLHCLCMQYPAGVLKQPQFNTNE